MKINKKEILESSIDKRHSYATTTVKFKSDLLDFFEDKDLDETYEGIICKKI